MAEKSKYYKHPQYGHVYGNFIATPYCRAAWPALVKPKDPPPPKPGEAPRKPSYQLTFILPKESAEVKAFLAKLNEMVQGMLELFNKGNPAKLAIESVVRDGDTFDLEKYPYYKGSWILFAKLDNTNWKGEAQTVQVIDGKKRPIENSMIDGGNIVAASIKPLVTARGVSYHLHVVQLVKDDGVKFAGAIAAPDTYLSIVEDMPTEEPAKENGKKEEPKSGKALALEVL